MKHILWTAGVATLAAALSGCIVNQHPEPEPTPQGPTGTGNAMDFYVKNVHASVAATCAGCHATATAPTFMADTAEGTYKAMEQWGYLIAAPADSKLLLRGPHAGPALMVDQQAIIREWLQAELDARQGAGDTGAALQEALSEVADCMDWEEFQALNIGSLALTATEQKGIATGACAACHNTGQGATFFDMDPKTMFNEIHKFPYLNRWFTGDGSVGGVRGNDRIIKKGIEAFACEAQPGEGPQYCHPTFEMPEEKQAALEAFLSDTLMNWAEGSCFSGFPSQ